MSASGKPEERARASASSKIEAVQADTSSATSLLGKIKARKAERAITTLSVESWMELCKTDKMAYATPAERLRAAIGPGEVIDTSKEDQKTRLVHKGKKIVRYKPFEHLFDMEDVVSDLVAYLEGGAEGMLVVRGPVGSGKTDIATTCEKLIESQPFYVLKDKKTGQISPFNDSPLCLLSDIDVRDDAAAELGIPQRYLTHVKSAWVTKRLEQTKDENGKRIEDPSQIFEVAKVYPSRNQQLGVAKLDPEDNKNADLSALKGSVDYSRLGEEDPMDPTGEKTLSEGDPDAYKVGVFSQSHQGVLHGAEFFRNNHAMLNAFLEPVTTGFFTGDKGVGMLPMDQVIIMTTNVPVWDEFMGKADSDAARNRIKVIDVPYTMRMSEELKIYDKFVEHGTHSDRPMAPGTKELLAEFAIVSRVRDGIGGGLKVYDPHIRARVLNGEIPDGAEKKVPKLHELRAKADPDEGMDGFTVRDAKKVLTDTYMARASEGLYEADTILLIETLREFIKTANKQDYPDDRKKAFEGFINTLAEENRKELVKKINSAIIDADDSACQRVFEGYLEFARAFITERDMYTKDGEPVDPTAIKKHLESFEKLAGIKNGEAFRQATVTWIDSEIARRAISNRGKPLEEQKDVLVRWDEYKPVAEAIRGQFEIDHENRKHILKASSKDDLRTEDEQRQYDRFHSNMKTQGYTESMVRRMLHHLDYT